MYWQRHKWSIVLAVFVCSRLLLYMAIPMQWQNTNALMQLPDRLALKTRFWESIWNLHAQPPLFNMLVGGETIVASDRYAVYLHQGLYSLLSLLSLYCVVALAKRLKVSENWSLLIGVAYCLFPTCLLYERSVSYVSPVMSLLVIVAWCFSRVDESRACVVGAVGGMALVVLSRSFYHWAVWMLPMTVVVVAVRSAHERAFNRAQAEPIRFWWLRKGVWQMLLCVVLLAALAGVPYARNFLKYGIFTSSTWQGMNVTRTLRFVPREKLDALVANGKISPLARLSPFSSPQAYLDYYQLAAGETRHIPILDNVLKSSAAPATGEETLRDYNFNHWIIPVASQEYQRNFSVIARAHPGAYLKSVWYSVYNFFGVDAYRQVPRRCDQFSFLGWLRALGIPVAMGTLFLVACLTFLAMSRSSSLAIRSPAVFILYSMCYVFLVSIMLESGESCVMRVPIDPFLVIGVGICLARGWSTGQARLSRGSPPPYAYKGT